MGVYGQLAAALLLPSAAHAQDVAPTPQAAPTPALACELHVWPGSDLGSIYYGWFHGGIVNGQVTGRKGYPVVPPKVIDTSQQVALLSEAKPQTLLDRPDYKLVLYTEALSSRTIRTSTTRIGPAEPTCYAELLVDDVILQQDVIGGTYLKVLFRFREFGAAATPQRTFSSWVQTKLTLFPPNNPEQLDAGISEVRAAYANDITLFAKAVLKPSKPKRHR